MNGTPAPKLVPTGELEDHFDRHGIHFVSHGSLALGFGHGNAQYRLYEHPAPAPDETMGLFCEWHTEDYFDAGTGPHVAIGLRGPVAEDAHRGRGLAIGILANATDHADAPRPLFAGCPDWPGGPSFFIEDFSANDGRTPIPRWQLSLGQPLPALVNHGIYRIDIHVSATHAWAGVWRVLGGAAHARRYEFLAETRCDERGPGFSGDADAPCPEAAEDRGRGNAFIGSGFSDPGTRSRMENIYIAHWKT